MSNAKVLAAFIAGKPKSYRRINVSSDGDRFYSWSMPIGIRVKMKNRREPVVVVNGDRVSIRTNRHQNELQHALRNAKLPRTTVSFSALGSHVGANRPGMWGSAQARDIADLLGKGKLILLDYTEDTYCVSKNYPYENTSSDDQRDDPPPAWEGWTSSKTKHIPYGGTEIEYWTAHRPGCALFFFQPPAPGGNNGPYILHYGLPKDIGYEPDSWSAETYPDAKYLVIKDRDGTIVQSCREPVDHSASLRFGFHASNGKTYESLEEWRKDYEALLAVLNDTTPPPPLYLLCGMDDGSYFCCAMPGKPRTVAAAFQQFMPKAVKGAYARGVGVKRQGEWYFVPTAPYAYADGPLFGIKNSESLPHLDRHMQSIGFTIRKGAALPLQTPTSNKHICTRIYEKGSVRYVVGRVRHDAGRRPSWDSRRGDHPMLTLYDGPLYRVYENKAIRSTSSSGRVD